MKKYLFKIRFCTINQVTVQKYILCPTITSINLEYTKMQIRARVKELINLSQPSREQY